MPGPPRTYQSPTRERQAQQTRRRIADAARTLLRTKGYAGMTVDAIAKKAGVAPQTIYATFKSKRGILADLIDRASFTPAFEELVRQAMATTDPEARLRFATRIAREIYESQSHALDLLRGAGVIAPELAALDRARDTRRYDIQEQMILFLRDAKRLRRGLDVQTARDILWSLTSRELYRLLVRERGWPPARYERWLADTLVGALLS